MKKLTIQRKRHLYARSRDELKKKSRVDRIHVVHTSFNLPLSNRWVYEALKAPAIFNLQYENVNEVLYFISRVKAMANDREKGLFIDLSEVTEIGEGAIAMLLTVMDEYGEMNQRMAIKGNQPLSKEANDILEKSGFFSLVTGHTINRKNKSEKNTLMTIGNADKQQTFLPRIIHSTNDTVWGVKGRHPLLYDVAFEMVRNSCDHAFKRVNSIKWYLAATHIDDQHLVKFSFVDNGKGILKTLNQGKLERVLNLFKDNVDLLTTAFQGKIASRTGFSWRGKGLPTIYENYDENYIRNLIVISNDVFLDFDRKIEEKLTVPFDGTYYFWIVDQDCEKLVLPI